MYATEAGGATSALPTAYVTNSQLTSLSVYSGATFAGTISNVGRGPTGIAVDPSTEEAYVADYGYLNEPAHTVTPVDLRTGTPGHPISVGSGPLAIALTPDGRDAVVTLQGTASSPGHQIREIDLATGAVSAPVGVGTNPESLAITPDGTMAYVAGFSSDEITPVNLTTWPPVAETPIALPPDAFPRAIAIAPDGKRAYVLDAEHATVIPINLATDHVGTAVSLVCQAQGDPGCTPDAITISPDGSDRLRSCRRLQRRVALESAVSLRGRGCPDGGLPRRSGAEWQVALRGQRGVEHDERVLRPEVSENPRQCDVSLRGSRPSRNRRQHLRREWTGTGAACRP